MRALPVLSLVLSGLTLLHATAPSAHARPRGKGKRDKTEAKDEPTAEAKEVARGAYARGQEAFNDGRYVESKSSFETAYAAVPNPIVLLSIAESQVKLGEIKDAIGTFKKYLEQRKDAPDRATVEGRIKALSGMPGLLNVTSEPTGVDLELDGFPTNRTTPTKLELAPGSHEITYSLSGYHGGSQTVEAEPGVSADLKLTLEPLPTLAGGGAAAQAAAGEPVDDAVPMETPSDASPAVTATPKSEPPTTALWITGGVGAAALVTGTVLGFLALKEHSDFEANPTEAAADRGERLALFADIGFGVGAMAIATAAVLYLTYDDEPAAGVDSAQATLRVVPALGPTSASATAHLAF